MIKRILCTLCVIVSLVACSSSDTPATTTTTTLPDNITTSEERALHQRIPKDQQDCYADRSPEGERRWAAAQAILFCESAEISQLAYASFENASAMDETYVQQAQHMAGVVEEADGAVKETKPGESPCAATPHESGQWGAQTGDTYGGRFTCVSHPNARIVWTERTNYVIGEAQSDDLSIEELVAWWINKAGPR